MSDPIATPDDLATYLQLGDSIDTDRATWLLARAQEKCEAILSPLPDTAIGVVCDIAGRAYTNPTAVQSSSPGPFQPQTSPIPGGLWLTRANIAELRRLSSSSGAFGIDPTPADAGPCNVWPQVPLSPDDWNTSPPYYGDWDWPPPSGS